MMFIITIVTIIILVILILSRILYLDESQIIYFSLLQSLC